jgi:hypothetical protein
MADVTLPDLGREVAYNLHKLSIADYRAMLDPGHSFDEEKETMALVTGLSVAEQDGLTLWDHKLLWREFWRVCREPLRDVDDPKA